MKIFLKWWLLFCIFVVACMTLQHFDLFTQLYYADISKLSIFILGVFGITTSYIGYLTYRLSKDLPVEEGRVEMCWFVANESPTVGLIGTVIGFLVMLGLVFVDIDVTDVVSVQEAIKLLALGMSSALVTTLVGMVCGLCLKLQLMNINDKT